MTYNAPAFLSLYFLFVTILTFAYFGYDKLSARTNTRRVSEKTLWFLALMGGSLGALVGMRVFRHKTKKLSFQAVLAVILLAQVWVVYLVLGKQN